MELDDDGRRECDGETWLADTGDFLALLSAALWVEHTGFNRRSPTVNTVERAIEYGRIKDYA